MRISAELLRIHIDYTGWASHRLLEAARTLSPRELTRDFATSEHNVVGTLAHVFAADRSWLARVRAEPPVPFITDEDRSLDVLCREWPRTLESWKEWARALTDESACAVLTYTDLRNRTWQQPAWQPVLHMVNHGTHHRGQVAGFLRAMGHTPPGLDLMLYYRELAKPPL